MSDVVKLQSFSLSKPDVTFFRALLSYNQSESRIVTFQRSTGS